MPIHLQVVAVSVSSSCGLADRSNVGGKIACHYVASRIGFSLSKHQSEHEELHFEIGEEGPAIRDEDRSGNLPSSVGIRVGSDRFEKFSEDRFIIWHLSDEENDL
ncbi:hypothetical protein WN944_018078 [Citrus x changshan-huyou]|uniref:Uncharacterized protein n=1 Tax=Citrus x changshan-huyou TaxID=2935761 RepID=A0AAP0LT23_9ROSI